MKESVETTMSSNRITLVLHGVPEELGHVRIGVFLQQLALLVGSLKRADRRLTGRAEAATYYRIVDLSHSSPARVVLEPVAVDPTVDVRGVVVESLFKTIEAIASGDASAIEDTDLVEMLRGMANQTGKQLAGLAISRNGVTHTLDKAFKEQADRILAPDRTEPGFVRGVLDAINIHGHYNVFWIYPVVGARKIACKFPPELRGEAIAGIGRTVEVHGVVHYRSATPFPHEVQVGSLEVFPADQELPGIMELRGASKKPFDRPSEEIIREMRDAGP